MQKVPQGRLFLTSSQKAQGFYFFFFPLGRECRKQGVTLINKQLTPAVTEQNWLIRGPSGGLAKLGRAPLLIPGEQLLV